MSFFTHDDNIENNLESSLDENKKSTPTTELDINRKNRENYENLMKDSSTQLDGYWDKNNVFVKLLLGVLGIIIVAGVAYYVMAYLGSR